MIVYNYDADLEVSDTCVRSSLLSWVEYLQQRCTDADVSVNASVTAFSCVNACVGVFAYVSVHADNVDASMSALRCVCEISDGRDDPVVSPVNHSLPAAQQLLAMNWPLNCRTCSLWKYRYDFRTSSHSVSKGLIPKQCALSGAQRRSLVMFQARS